MTSSGITVSTNQRGTGRPELVLRVCLCVCGAKKKIKMKRICSFERKRKGKCHNVGMKQRPPEKASDQQRRVKGRCVDAAFLRIHALLPAP